MDKKKLIADSLDARCERFNIKLKLGVYISLVIFLAALSVTVFWDYPKEMVKALTYYNIIFAVSYVPLILFSVFRISGIIKRTEDYIISEADLDEFHSSMGKFYFRVNFTDEKGRRYSANTEAFFSTRSSVANFEEWHGERVMIAYDPYTGKALVLCKK